MKRRILCFLLTLCVVLTLVPSVALAAEERYGVWILDEEITSSRKISQKEGWEFDPNTYTLTLRNFQIGTIGTKISALFDKYSLFGLIYVDTSVDDLTIRLEGKESYLGDEAFPYENCNKNKEAYYGICATGTNLTITGNRGAILKIETHENAIECKSLTIKDSVTVEAVSQGTCIYAGGDITIEGLGTLVNARTTDIIKGQAAVSTRGKLYVGESSYLVTCSVAKSSSWERVGFYPNYPDTNYISSLYVAGVATVDGGIITAYFYKRKGSYINEYDYSIEDYGETKAFYCHRLDINNGGEVNVFFERAEGKDPQNEYGFDSSDTADSWEDLWRGSIYFQGDGVMRVGMTNGKREENAIAMRNRLVLVGPHVKLSRTNCPPQVYSKYSDYVELTGKKHNSITLFMQQGGGRLNPWWSYYTDKSDATYIGGTLALKDIVASDLDLKLTAEPGSYTVDPMVNAGCAIPEMVVQSGATLKLTMQRGENYTFTKPIWLEGGNLEIDGTTANITGLDVRGTGTVTFNGGTVSGTVEKTVKMVVKGGNIDVPDYGNAVDGNGNAVHKFVYTVETEERYTQPLQIKTMTKTGEYDTVSLNSGLFHRGENNERLVYLWLDRSDRVLRLRVNDPNENEHKDCLALRFGTNVFTEGPHLNMRSSGTVVAREGERLTLSAIENQTPTDMQNQYVTSVLWFLSTDGGKNFQQIRYSYGKMGGVSYDYTIPSVTKEQNGYIYRAVVTYVNAEDAWGGTTETYTYEATIYMDQPELRAPTSYVVGQTAKFEVVHPTLPEGITMKYFWQTSKDGESWNEIPSIFGASSTYEPEITADMAGMQVRAVVQTWKNYSRVGTTILGPVTINISGRFPRITEQPKDSTGGEREDISIKPGIGEDGSIIIIIASRPAFSVKAEGENLQYQWQVSTDGGRTYTDYENKRNYGWVTGPEFDESIDGWLFRCVVSNEYGSVVSEPGRVTTHYPPKFTSNPTNKTAKAGQGTYFDARFKQGVPYGADVTWQVSTDGGKNFRDAVEIEDGVTLVMERSTEKDGVLISEWYTSFTVSKATKDMDGYKYRCVIKNTPNDRDYNGIRYSAAVTLTVTRNCAVEGHELDEGTVTTAPTCTATGLKTFTCSACGGTEVTILPALDHDWAAATCMTPKTCRRDGCGAKEGTVDPSNHTGEKVWSTTERRHIQRYNCCGLVTVETEDHTWEKGVCTLCAYRCVSHTGGTATCVKKAECEICGEEYGNYGSHDYAADWTSDEQEHWHGCALCDSRSDAGMHADGDKDHLCDTCGRTISGHTGGTATCVKKAVCEDCGEAYGEADGGNHEALVRVPAKAATKDAEGNSEYWYCSACGKYYGDAEGAEEITEADTVIAKLPQTPQTGDSGLTLWLTLLLGAAMAAAVMGKKKKA